MKNFTALERVLGDALLRNDIVFHEQVYTKTEISHYIFDYVVYGEACKIVVECDGVSAAHKWPEIDVHKCPRIDRYSDQNISL